MTKRVLPLLLLFSVIICSSVFATVEDGKKAASGVFTLQLGTNVKDGSGTFEEIENIPGYDINGITIYLGYRLGNYSANVQMKDLVPMSGENEQHDTVINLVPADDESAADTSVTIYLAADSNVKSNVSVRLGFNAGEGWIRENGDFSIEILSYSGVRTDIMYPDNTNVTAVVIGGEQIQLNAHPGKPKGEATPIIAYSVLTWPNEGIPAGNYNADVSVVIVNEG